MKSTQLHKNFFLASADEVAEKLIGATLLFGNAGLGGTIIETEAYDETDPTSHCWRRHVTDEIPYGSRPMFLSGGHAYIYRSNPYCLNFVCDRKGFGSAVLIRSLKPNPKTVGRTDGPARLCATLRVNYEHNNLALDEFPFRLIERPIDFGADQIQVSTRVKLNKEKLLKKCDISETEIDTAIAMKRRWFVTLTN